MKDILVVAAHPDDEVLGCGATMAKHSRQGDRVHVLILAQGLIARDGAHKSGLVGLKAKAQKANNILGVSTLSFADFPDNQMDTVALLDVTKRIEKAISEHSPSIIYTHYFGDVNIDHRRIHEAVMAAARPQPGKTVDTLLFFEIPSSSEWQTDQPAAFVPNWFIDVSMTMNLKMKALHAYASEMRPWPHARSYRAIKSLMEWRGGTAGFEAAEAFSLGRRLA